MATFRDLLKAAKAEVTSITTDAAAERVAQGYTVLDVREPDEYQEGALTGAIHIPRGHLESQVENRISDKTTKVVVYCAGGVRADRTRGGRHDRDRQRPTDRDGPPRPPRAASPDRRGAAEIGRAGEYLTRLVGFWVYGNVP